MTTHFSINQYVCPHIPPYKMSSAPTLPSPYAFLFTPANMTPEIKEKLAAFSTQLADDLIANRPVIEQQVQAMLKRRADNPSTQLRKRRTVD